MMDINDIGNDILQLLNEMDEDDNLHKPIPSAFV